MELTKNETKAIQMCLNYNNRASQLSDNYSNAGAEDFANMLFNGNLQAAGGLITSLTNKGMGDMDTEGYDIFWLSETAVNLIFNMLDKNPNNYTVMI